MSGCSDIRARVQISRHLSRDISWIPKNLGIYRDLSSIWLRQKTRHLSKRLSRLTWTGQVVYAVGLIHSWSCARCVPSCVPLCLRSCVLFGVCSRVSCPGLRFVLDILVLQHGGLSLPNSGTTCRAATHDWLLLLSAKEHAGAEKVIRNLHKC